MRASSSPGSRRWSAGAYSRLTASTSDSPPARSSTAAKASATRASSGSSSSSASRPARSRRMANRRTVTITAVDRSGHLRAYPAAMATEERLTVAPIVGPDDPRRFTDSGIEVKPLYTEDDLPGDLAERLGEPGSYPYTRGVHREMYRKQLWTMRQYAGYASAKESNERYRYLLQHGSTGLSMAFDLPTQLGLDSDDPRCLGEVGRTGVAIDTIEDMRTAFDGIPLDQVSTSMTINAPAAVLLLLYELVAEEQGVAADKLRGTTQNDVLKEYIARGNYIYPPEPTMRLTTDLFAYCAERIPKWNTVSISGYHFREKGASAVQEVAFTLCSGIAYVQAAIDAGLAVDQFAPRLAFFFNCHNNVFQEVAKFRAARRMWAQIMRERFGATDPRSLKLRFHTQTGGVTLTDEIESRAYELIAKVDELGGSVNAIEFITGEIDESAWGYQERYRIGQDVVVGVNRFVEDDPEVPSDLLRIDPDSEHRQVERLEAFKADRDAELVERRLEELRETARGTGNLLPAIRAALKDRCSLGEVCGAMADVFGRYTPTF